MRLFLKEEGLPSNKPIVQIENIQWALSMSGFRLLSTMLL